MLFRSACADSGTIAVSDNKSNTWTAVSPQVNNASATISVRMFYCAHATGGAGHTFTVSGATNACNISMQEFSNVFSVLPFDVTASNTGATNANLNSSASSALAQSVELIVGGGGTDGSILTLALGTGYTNLTSSSVATWLIGGQESKL